MEDGNKMQQLRAHAKLMRGIDNRRQVRRREWVTQDIINGDQTRFTSP